MAKTAAEATQGLTGKADDKRRPTVERLAHLEGKSTFTDPREPRGTWIDITDLDVMAAVAMSRMTTKNANGECVSDPSDVGPEILETYYGSTAKHRRRIATAYMAQEPNKPVTKHHAAVRRMAAMIAAQKLGGCHFDGAQWAELAWIVVCRKQEFMDLVASAMAWMEGERDRARRAFDDCFQTINEGRERDARDRWRQQRADRLAGKRKARTGLIEV